MSIINYLNIYFHRIKGLVVMIHWNHVWRGSRFNIIVINIFVKAYGENEWGSFYWNQEVTHTTETIQAGSILAPARECTVAYTVRQSNLIGR